jgi:hypothetical protein
MIIVLLSSVDISVLFFMRHIYSRMEWEDMKTDVKYRPVGRGYISRPVKGEETNLRTLMIMKLPIAQMALD